MLRDYPKEVILKSGEKVILRPMVKEDEQKLLEFFLRLPEEDRLFLKNDVTDPKVIESWARNLNYEHVIPILAEIGGRIIGDATLHKRTTEEPPNIGEIRLVTDRDFRRRGLGTMLAKEVYYLALSLKLNRLVAEVVEDQHAVIKTFKSLGFQHETTLKDRAIDLHGLKHNLVVMTEDVDALWKTIEDLIHKDTAHYSRE
ncbi:GNAT family N-acetyltransferase [candidate division WOR-3 bacterium]|nr:GNAT family N-acetyltransferase [candidate division WOR-3 bacterium]